MFYYYVITDAFRPVPPVSMLTVSIGFFWESIGNW